MRTLFAPWRHPGRLALAAGLTFTAMVVAPIMFGVTVALLSTAAGLLITFVLALPFAWLLFALSRWFGRFERGRVFAFSGERIADPVPPLVESGRLRRLWERVQSKARWKEIIYHLLHLPVSVLSTALTAGSWGGAVALNLMPAYVRSLPGDSAKFWLFEIHPGPGAWLAAVVGAIGLLVVAPWITVSLARAQVAMARFLLGPTRDAAHAAEVARLQHRRSAAVESAESERRRIERDLHDGAQQRLVALAANLGAAKEKLDRDDGGDVEAGRAMVADAHEEAKAALKEIRDLVRGIHPVILEDRGLDAALSAVVARSPVPVELQVDVAERPPAAVESAAYFVVSEALTNVARHAMATRAQVAIARAGGRLVIEVRDNGAGGADAGRGTGLRGLRDRVDGMGGSMFVISPPGGPTTISVELPCGS